jgi:proteic killer suppression protein
MPLRRNTRPWCRTLTDWPIWRADDGLDIDAAIDLLLALNVAKSINDLSPLASVGLHRLKGTRKGQWAMTVNGPWRVCFEFRKGDAYNVEIVDYHKG